MQEVIYILRFIIFFISLLLRTLFSVIPFYGFSIREATKKVCAEPLGSNPANGTCIEPVKR